MDRIKVAIIGMGRMGRCRYDTMINHGGYEIVALCDNNANMLINYDERVYTDWKECLDNEDVEAVFVCTINSVIPDVVCAALEKGIHVFSEKPPGRCLDDVFRMRDAYDGTGLVLKYGFNHRYHNSVIEAKTLIDSGLLGEVVCARGVYGKAGSLMFQSEWRNDPQLSGGGILLDQGIHMLDLMRYFVGDFTEIQASVDNLVWNDIPTEDSAFAILKTNDGKIASIHSSAVQWKHKFDMDIVLTEGYIALNGLLTSTKSYGEERITFYRKDLAKKSGKLGNPKEYVLCFDSEDSWAIEIEEFYEAVVNGKSIVNGTIDDAVAAMSLVEGIYEQSGWKVAR